MDARFDPEAAPHHGGSRLIPPVTPLMPPESAGAPPGRSMTANITAKTHFSRFHLSLSFRQVSVDCRGWNP